MPGTLSDFAWAILVFVLGVCATLVGIIYSTIDRRLNDHDNRIRTLEVAITDKLNRILNKLGVDD